MGLEPFEGLVLEARRKRKNFFGNPAGVKSKNQRCMYARRLKDLLNENRQSSQYRKRERIKALSFGEKSMGVEKFSLGRAILLLLP